MLQVVVRKFCDWLLQLLDVVSLLAGFALALLVDRFHQFHSLSEAVAPIMKADIHLSTALVITFVAVAWGQIFEFFRLYPRNARYFHESHLRDLVKAVTFGILVFVIFGSVFDFISGTDGDLHVHLVCLMWLFTLLFCLLARILVGFCITHLFANADLRRRVLIIGSSNRAVDFARELAGHHNKGVDIMGYVDSEWRAGTTQQPGSPGLVCDFAGFQDFLRTHIVDQVCICLPLRSFYDQASNIVDLCLEQGIDVSLNTQLFNIISPPTGKSLFRDTHLMTVYSTLGDERQIAMKRAFDFTVVTLLILLLLPLLILVAILIKLDSKGPVFFIQERVGFNKRLFQCLKFRTMVVDAEKMQAELEDQNEAKGAHFKMRSDPRVTRLGYYLRKFSIDELPQLFNVFLGDMSLVGPRPLSIRDFKLIEADWPRRRFSVIPGITCLWQISGRSELNFRHWMALDMEYIDHWSLALDLKILIKTIPVVLFGKGAY